MKSYKWVYPPLLLIVLFVPLMQLVFGFSREQPLVGVEYGAERPKLSFKKWFNGEFQGEFEKWFNQSFGFRSSLIKTNNQVYYSLFKESGFGGEGIIVGKEGQLFGKQYIDNYMQYMPPVSDFNHISKYLKTVQILLNKRGINFIVLITPTKPSIYPEYIPQRYRVKKHYEENFNYTSFIQSLKSEDINIVDGQSFLLDKKEEGHPLFPQGGLHWNGLGAYFVAEQLLKKMDELSNDSISQISLESISEDNNPMGADKDLVDLMNLWVKPDKYVSVTPHIKTTSISSNLYKPKVLLEGGSFNYQLMGIFQSNQIFSEQVFFNYYNHSLTYSDEVASPEFIEINSLDWDKDVFDKDFIILEINLLYITDKIEDLGSGFVIDLLNKLTDSNNATKH